MKRDHIFEKGCCLTCAQSIRRKGCWCSLVLCRECMWYNGKEDFLEGRKGSFRGMKGFCEFPKSEFGLLNEVSIKVETEKAYLIKFKGYGQSWFPKKGCHIEKEGGNLYINIAGWLLLLKLDEFEEKGKDELWELFFNDVFEKGYTGRLFY